VKIRTAPTTFSTAVAIVVSLLTAEFAAAQQDLLLQGDDGAVTALSAPFDITKTQSWGLSSGRVDWNELLRPEGRITNRSRQELTFALYLIPNDERSAQRFVTAGEENSIRAFKSGTDAATRLASDVEILLSLGESDTPLLLKVTLPAGGRADLSRLSARNQRMIGALMSSGPVRLLLVAHTTAAASALVEIIGFNLPLRPEAFPGMRPEDFPGTAFFPRGQFFPGEASFSARSVELR
jgi:hypothetical protein